MAGEATLECNLTITGLGSTVKKPNSKALTVPVKHIEGSVILATAGTTAYQLFTATTFLALTKIFCVWIKSISGTIYIKPNTAGTTTFNSTTAVLVINEGEAYAIPVNPDVNAGMTIDADATDAEIEFSILGKA